MEPRLLKQVIFQMVALQSYSIAGTTEEMQPAESARLGTVAG
jgi:hypothetical protein